MSRATRVLATVRRRVAAAGALTALAATGAWAQTGQIVGRVVRATDSAAVAQAEVLAVGSGGDTTRGRTTAGGEFVLVGLAPGRYALAVRRLGLRAAEVRGLLVRSGISTRVTVVLTDAVELAPLVVQAEERPLLTPDVSASRQVVGRDEIQAAPVQDVEQLLELRTGVADGHFRGGRVGQETYVIDGVDVKDQFAASRSGIAFQLAPTAVQEVSVFTSGFSADQPSAVSGVVTLVSRSGPTDGWFGRVEGVTDEWAPAKLDRGYARVGATTGGPLWGGSTLFLDLLMIGRADQDPRVRGLSCLEVTFPCPAQRTIIPHHEGDRYLAFGRLDLPLGGQFNAALSLSRNRDQHELYSTRFKYALRDYLAERETATLGTMLVTGTFNLTGSRALRLASSVSVARLDRYLGVPDTVQPARLGRFRLGDLRFRGEDFVRRPAAEQLGTGQSIPGYLAPSDSGLGSPYGIFGADLFVTDGTSGIAEWTRADFADVKLGLQTLASPQMDLKVGGDLKLHRITTYQHVSGGSAGAAPNFARFYPHMLAGYIHATLYALDAATVDLGARLEAFQPGLAAPENRRDLTAPTVVTQWRTLAHPRVGFAMPLAILGVPRASVRWNYGRFAQPPDFQFFFDQALDDSLNTAVRRQGNPYLGFEYGTQYEGGIDYLLTGELVLRASGYLKDLASLTTSGITLAEQGRTFTNLDFGKVQGLEVRLEGRWGPSRRLEVGYALQKAIGVVSTAFDSTESGGVGGRVEIPLQFDRRHAIDVNALWQLPWGTRVAVGASAGSGYPVPGAAERRLPWTVELGARVAREWRWGARAARVILEGRNLLNRANLVTARFEGGVMPNVLALEARASQETAGAQPIPRDSPLYVPGFDLNSNGILDPSEQTAARRAALLDFYEPTLLYGEARQVRVGVEIVF
jgi:hypothetical protein